MASPILATKLYIPQSRRDLVPRPQLFERLNRGAEGVLVLVSAPAGFGKTTLVGEWARQAGFPCGWISLDDSDNDPGRFLTYFIASLQAVRVDVEGQLIHSLQSPQTDLHEAVLIPLVNQIAAAETRFALVLDDYHRIQSQEVHRALLFLLDHLPPNMHLVIASRADPPFPLARLRARGQLTEIRESDLRFSLAEGDILLNQVQDLRLSEENIQVLVDRTAGWIAALQMVSLALKGKADVSTYIRAVTGSQDYIADFLTAEVIEGQPGPIREFLVKTSILERLSGPLCDAVLGRTGSQLILKILRDENVFLFSLDDESLWFRYHGLFADLLQQRLAESYPGAAPALYLKASEWFEGHGSSAEAIEYALQGKHIGRAASLIEQVAEATLIRSEISTFVRWIEKLPDEVVQDNANLSILYAWALLIRGEQLETAKACLDRVTSDGPQTRSRLNVVRAMLAQFRRQDAQAITLGQQALAELPEDDFFFRSIAAWNLSAILYLHGEPERGIEMLAEVARTSRAGHNDLVSVITTCRLGAIESLRGNLHQARVLFEQALDLAVENRRSPLPVACEAMLGLGKIFWEWGELEAARARLSEGVELSKRWRESSALDGFIHLAFLHQAEGDRERADEMLTRAAELAAASTATETDDRYVASRQAFLWVRQGELPRAWRWVEWYGFDKYLAECTLVPDHRASTDILLRYELIVFARVLIASGRSQDALHILDLILPGLEARDHREKVIEINILTALARGAQGDLEEAVSALAKGIERAKPGGYVRVFLDEGQEMARLLRALVSRGVEKECAERLLGHFQETYGTGTPPAALVEPLTERELEVLRWLASDLSVPEMAEHLYIAVSTLRTHVKNIYAKLEVHNRFAAVSQARELGLI